MLGNIACGLGFCHRIDPDTGRTKPFSRGDEAILKQTAAYPAGYKRGMTNMQFFFDLIWGQSRSRYLAEMGQMEAPND